MRARVPFAALLAAALAAGPLSGCAPSVDPIERLGRKAAQKVGPRHERPDRPYRRWGLDAPLAPAPRPPRPPADWSSPKRAGPPKVLDRVPTRDRVVFLTYDEGAERNPRFLDMVRELRLPVSVFLGEAAAGPDDARLARLRTAGAVVESRPLGHRALRGRPYGEQRAAICGRRDRPRRPPGSSPRLLRPPYGAYDRTTLRAAADCGVTALILWRPRPFPPPVPGAGPGSLVGGTPDHGPPRAPLGPGDIVRPHEPGHPLAELPAETARVLRRAQASGLTVARLEDYL
ncbi:polysaccharide deacetylase family protein [Streptomyces sp. NPDC048664]|uniref:polysaccharide deacetylase family protein n=1 Tax=Streptomyces sp. NPDC048664 TaxID=3154505 RepID=UPI00342BB19B